MSKKNIEGWGVVKVPCGRLGGIFKTQAAALDKMLELSPAYLVCFAKGVPRPVDFLWQVENMPDPASANVVTYH